MNRRTFLQGGALSTVLPIAPLASSHLSGKNAFPSNAAQPFEEPASASAVILPSIPESFKEASAAEGSPHLIRMYWMMRQGWDYEQVKKFGSHAGQPGHRDGVQ